jgi:hypothetical protein
MVCEPFGVKISTLLNVGGFWAQPANWISASNTPASKTEISARFIVAPPSIGTMYAPGSVNFNWATKAAQ